MKIEVHSVPFVFWILDFVMSPIMWALSGFKWERPIETHPWHIQRLDFLVLEQNLDRRKMVVLESADVSKVSARAYGTCGIVHMPLFGGWTRYVIIEAQGFQNHWHIGWKIQASNFKQCAVQMLNIYTPVIKLLEGADGQHTEFFAVDEQGEQIPIRKMAGGKLGDGKFRNVRLF